MPAGLPLEAVNLAGTHKSSAEKTLDPSEVFKGKNYRQNKEGGRYPRPGFEDSGIDLSSYGFIAGKGIRSSRSPKKLWFAADTGSAVKILYVETDQTLAQYGTVFDTGVSLQTGYYVEMIEFEGDIYYANGYDPVGRIIVGQVGTGGVTAASITLNLKTGNGVRFPASGSGLCGTDAFTWGGLTTDQLTTVAGILDHSAGEVITVATTLSPTYADKASVLAEWLATLNLGGDIDNPRVLEFSQFASASNLAKFYTFGSSPAGSELLGEGGEITGIFPTKNFLFILKSTGIYGAARADIDLSTGARIPQPINKFIGVPNPRCIAQIDEDVAVALTTSKSLIVLRGSIINGASSVQLEEGFDTDIQKDLSASDTPGASEWVTYNEAEKLLKVCVLRGGVRYVYVKDMNIGVWYDADQGKNYDVVTTHTDLKTWAFDGSVAKLYRDETGNYDDDVPIESEWETGRMLPFIRIHGRTLRLNYQRAKSKELLTHGFMKLGSVAYLDFYLNSVFQFTKTLTQDQINNMEDGTQIGFGAVGSGGFGDTGAAGTAFPFQWFIGTNRKGEDFKIKVRTTGENGDFVQFDGFRLNIHLLRRSPQSRT